MRGPLSRQRTTLIPLVRKQARHLAETSIKSTPLSGVVKLTEERRRQHHAIYTRISTLRFVVRTPMRVGKICVVRHTFESKKLCAYWIRCFRTRSRLTRICPGIWPSLLPTTTWHTLNGLLYSWIWNALRLFPDNMGCPAGSLVCPTSLQTYLWFYGCSYEHLLSFRNSVGGKDYLKVCWWRHKNHDIDSVCHHRGFLCPMSNSDAPKMWHQQTYEYKWIQNQSE